MKWFKKASIHTLSYFLIGFVTATIISHLYYRLVNVSPPLKQVIGSKPDALKVAKSPQVDETSTTESPVTLAIGSSGRIFTEQTDGRRLRKMVHHLPIPANVETSTAVPHVLMPAPMVLGGGLVSLPQTASTTGLTDNLSGDSSSKRSSSEPDENSDAGSVSPSMPEIVENSAVPEIIKGSSMPGMDEKKGEKVPIPKLVSGN
jgi:hypothetical protein